MQALRLKMRQANCFDAFYFLTPDGNRKVLENKMRQANCFDAFYFLTPCGYRLVWDCGP